MEASLQLRYSAATEAKAAPRISPATITAINLLAMSTSQMEGWFLDAAERNPFLDFSDSATELFSASETPREADALPSDVEGDGFDLESLACKRSVCSGPVSRFEDAASLDYLTDSFSFDSLKQTLRLQMNLCGLSEGQFDTAVFLLEDIDDSGYYRGDLDEAARHLRIPLAEAESALKLIQGLLPRGVGARSLEECLLLQLDKADPFYDIKRRVIREDMESVARNRISLLMKKYMLSEAAVFDVLNQIKSLDPLPGNAFPGGGRCGYIVPDIEIRKNDVDYAIHVLGEEWYQISVSEQYVRMLSNAELRNEDRKYLNDKLREAEELIKAYDFRNATLHRFGLFLLESQPGFVLRGLKGLVPMSMQDAAAWLDLSISTISRLVKDKYIRMPHGSYLMRSLFTSGCSSSSLEDKVSAETIKWGIRQIISQEDKSAPNSDEELSKKLRELVGVAVARRTVAKYRSALGIPGSGQRRCC